MSNKEIYFKIGIVVFIFALGLIVRFDSIYLFDTPSDNKSYYQDADGLPYMFEIDSYYNYRLTENLIEHGYLGDIRINGTEWDLHSYYPPGVPLDYPPMITYLAAFIYYLINLFSTVPLLNVVFWISIFIAPISGVVAYFLVSRFTNDYGALAAGIFVVTAPMYALRTVAGWFDTDIFIIFLPLLVTLFLFLAVEKRNNLHEGIFYALLTAITMFIFSLAWNGYQYIFYFVSIFLAIYIMYCKIKGREIRKLFYIFIVFLSVTLLLIFLFSGFINIYKLFAGPLELIKITNNPWMPWPDVYTTVSELNKPSIVEIISNIGITFFAGVLGLFWMFRILINKNMKNKLLRKMNWFFYLYLLLWSLIGIISLFKGNRFVMLLIPPLAINAGIFIGIVVEYLYLLQDSQKFAIFRKKRNLIPLLAILIVICVSIPALYSVHQSVSSLKPIVNDDLWDVSAWINNYTSNDTVIISQWSYGHLFTAIADRSVVFDGRMGYIETLPNRINNNDYPFGSKSPAVYREYWINKAFTTDNESLSKGIFTMLASSGDLAYLTLNNYTNNTTESVEILNNILGLDKSSANQTLTNKYNLSQEKANAVLKYTHPNKSNPYVLVTSDGFLGIGQGIFEYGEWDFNENHGYNYTYFWNYFNTTNGIINNTDGLYYDTVTGKITWNNKTPYKLITITKGNKSERLVDNNSDFNIYLIMDEEKVVIMDKRFEKSLFTKLIIEKSNDTNFKMSYRRNNVIVWQN